MASSTRGGKWVYEGRGWPRFHRCTTPQARLGRFGIDDRSLEVLATRRPTRSSTPTRGGPAPYVATFLFRQAGRRRVVHHGRTGPCAASPVRLRRAASRLCGRQRILQFVDRRMALPSPAARRGPPPAAPSRRRRLHRPGFHRHIPWSLLTTSRFTLARTQAFRFACFSMSNSRPAAVQVSPRRRLRDSGGSPLPSPSSAAPRNFLDTVTCILLDVAVIGSTSVRSTSVRGMPSSPGRISGTVCFNSSTGSTGRDACTRVTTILVLGTGRGWSSATSSWASRAERPKKRGATTVRFFLVSTLASSATVERQSRPSRSGSITSGKSWSSSAALFR